MRPWRPFGASWLKKWCSKRPSKNDQILIPFRYWILTLSAPFWDAKILPKSIQNRSKLGSRPIRVSASIFTSIFDRFCIRKWTSRTYKIVLPLQREHDFSKIGIPSRHRFLCDFHSNLEPFWLPKLIIFLNFYVSKMPSKLHRFSHRFFIDFGSVLASNLAPSWKPRRPKIQKNGFQKLSCCSPRAVRNTIFLVNTVLDRFGIDFGRVRARF